MKNSHSPIRPSLAKSPNIVFLYRSTPLRSLPSLRYPGSGLLNQHLLREELYMQCTCCNPSGRLIDRSPTAFLTYIDRAETQPQSPSPRFGEHNLFTVSLCGQFRHPGTAPDLNQFHRPSLNSPVPFEPLSRSSPCGGEEPFGILEKTAHAPTRRQNEIVWRHTLAHKQTVPYFVLYS